MLGTFPNFAYIGVNEEQFFFIQMHKHDTQLTLLSKARFVDGKLSEPRVIIVTPASLAELFKLTLQDAANSLGICESTLKR